MSFDVRSHIACRTANLIWIYNLFNREIIVFIIYFHADASFRAGSGLNGDSISIDFVYMHVIFSDFTSKITGFMWCWFRVSINWQARTSKYNIVCIHGVQRLAVNFARSAKGESDHTECFFSSSSLPSSSRRRPLELNSRNHKLKKNIFVKKYDTWHGWWWLLDPTTRALVDLATWIHDNGFLL